jgi:hypothetical protein
MHHAPTENIAEHIGVLRQHNFHHLSARCADGAAAHAGAVRVNVVPAVTIRLRRDGARPWGER